MKNNSKLAVFSKKVFCKKSIIGIIFLVFIFYSFGFYHLTKFETVDEHFWKYERIPQYWQAIHDGNWKKTYINDKPGVSVAIMSGIGLLFEPHPENHRVRDNEKTKDNLLTIYDSSKTEKINLSLRLPILIFNGLFLFFFFWIIKRITDSDWVASFSVMFMALSPILVGISQIINPDSLLWVFFFSSLLSYLALLQTKERKFLILSIIFTGLSLLSKYSAMILFPFYFFILLSYYFIQWKKINESEKAIYYFRREILNLCLIFIGSLAVFSLLMPAVFVKLKYLYRGTIGFSGFQKIVTWLLVSFGLISLDILFLRGGIAAFLGSFFHKHRQKIFRLAILLLFITFSLILINCWSGQRSIPFDKMQDKIYIYNNTRLLDIAGGGTMLVRMVKVFLFESYPFVFSIHPVFLILVLCLFLILLVKGIKKYGFLIFVLATLIIFYFLALALSNVAPNARYNIIIYPLFFLLFSLIIEETLAIFKIKEELKNYFRIAVLIIIFIFCFTSLWKIKPFYFNYTNFLLPKEFSIADAWGYGEYEAAQYLNSIPNADNLQIWSDRNGICQFIKGSCITGYKIDLNKIKPDYFVISRRGSMRYRFEWKFPELAKMSSGDYYKNSLVNSSEWELFIEKRPKNFVKVIKANE